MLIVADIMSSLLSMCGTQASVELWWNVMTRETEVKPDPVSLLSNINPKWIYLGTNPGLLA
jgi:hypothetical protein